MPAQRGRALALVSLASLGWAFSFGLGAPLSAALHIGDAGHSHVWVGVNTSLYYLGVAVAAPFVPLLMRRANRRCVAAGMLLDAATTALFPFCDGLLAWHLLRLVGGVGTAMSLIPMETLVNQNAAPEHRSRDFSVYAVCVALGLAVGAAGGVALYASGPRLAFALGGAVTLLAVPLAWAVVPATSEKDDAAGGNFAWRSGLFGFGTAWAQGFLEGGTLAFLSPYLLGRGLDHGTVSGLLGGLFAGVVAAQLPVAWLADRFGRMRILLLCHCLMLAALLVAPWAAPLPLLGACLFVLGACCGAMYPLGLSLLGERVPASGMARANAWYLACNCAGSLSGPFVMGVAVHACGLPAQFAVGIVAVVMVLAVGAAARREASACGGRERRAA